MKLFDIEEPQFAGVPSQGILIITDQACNLIINICKVLKMPMQTCHYALWVFHCNAGIMTYHKFDRFVYVCAAIMVGMKLGQSLYSFKDIIKQCRKLLKEKKKVVIEDEEEEAQQIINKFKKKVLEAELTIMINIGFDFDIHLALQYFPEIRNEINDSHLSARVQKMLTSLYKTQTVIFFHPELLCLTALLIVLKNEGINLKMLEFSAKLMKKLQMTQLLDIQKCYLARCILNQ